MKRKFNRRLTICLVSLFVSIVMLCLQSVNKIFTNVGLSMLGIAIFFGSLLYYDHMRGLHRLYDQEMRDIMRQSDEQGLSMPRKDIKRVHKYRRRYFAGHRFTFVCFAICGVLIFVLPILMFFI